MDFLYLADTSDTPPTKPLNPATGYPSNGDPVNGKAPTTLGAWIFYAWSEEFKNLLATLGIVPDANNLHQLADYFARYKADIGAMLPGDMANYTTKMKDIDNKLSNLDLFKRTAESTYAKTADLAAKADKVANDADHAKFNTALATLKAEDSAIKTSLGDYAKTADVDSKLKGYATKADVAASASQGKFIKANGNRGQIGGYSTQYATDSAEYSITVESPDDLYVYAKARRTIKFVAGEEDQVATKVVHVQSHRTSGCAITWEGCVWASGSAPVFGNPSADLIVVARFSAGKVYASVFQNSQG